MGIYQPRQRGRSGRDQAGRVDQLEDALLPPPQDPPGVAYYRRMWDAIAWGGHAGGRASEISAPIPDLLNEQLRITFAALDAGEITLGERFPRLLTGGVHLSPERQAQWEAVTRQIDGIVCELEAMREQARQHVTQHGGSI